MAFEQIKFKNCFISLNEIKFTLLKFFRLALEILPFTSSSVLSIIICHQTERKEKPQYIASSYLSRFFTYKQKYNYIKHSSSLFLLFLATLRRGYIPKYCGVEEGYQCKNHWSHGINPENSFNLWFVLDHQGTEGAQKREKGTA